MSMIASYHPRRPAIAPNTPDTTWAELAQILDQARIAAPTMAATAPRERQTWLYRVAAALVQHAEELVAIADHETHLGVERLTAEVGRTAAQLRFYGDVAREGSFLGVSIDERTATTPRLVRVNRPLGPVAVFGASNFPFAFGVLGNDTGSAIAAGCPVIVKGHPAHAQLSSRLAGLADDALTAEGAPSGTFALVNGFETGVDLVKADTVAAVAFTGSQSGGLALWRIANERKSVIPVFAEMGTVNPAIVTRRAAAHIARIAEGFVGSFTLGSGQFCTKPGILFAPRGCRAAQTVGDALTAADPRPTLLTQAIAAAFETGLTELIAAGAEVVRSVPAGVRGWSASATVLRAHIDALTGESRLLEECFGPVAVVVEYDDDAELEAALASLQGSLAASVFAGDDDPDLGRIVAQVTASVGRVIVNEWPTGVAFTWAQQHGGPWPATTNPSATSVGAAALNRFVRPVAFQSAPEECLPPEARSANPWRLPCRLNGIPTPAWDER